MSDDPLAHKTRFTLGVSLRFPRQPWEALRSPGVEQKSDAGRYKDFVSATLPHLIGMLISLQLHAVLLAHVSDLT